eukprot:6481317-Amphidinium_carterae.1
MFGLCRAIVLTVAPPFREGPQCKILTAHDVAKLEQQRVGSQRRRAELGQGCKQLRNSKGPGAGPNGTFLDMS